MGTAVSLVHESRCPELGPICLEREEPPQLHHQSQALLELRASAALALGARLGLELELPFRVSQSSVRYTTLDGAPLAPEYQDIHHRNETLVGPADPYLLGRWSAWPGQGLFVRAGASLPLGRTEPNPYALAREGQAHQHVQLGSGTVDPLFGLEGRWRFGERELGVVGFARLPLYANRHGYQAGASFLARLELAGPLVGELRGALGADLALLLHERWDGAVDPEGASGSVDALTRLGLAFPVADFFVFADVWVRTFQAKLPGPPGAHGELLRFPLVAQLGVRRGFELP